MSCGSILCMFETSKLGHLRIVFNFFVCQNTTISQTHCYAGDAFSIWSFQNLFIFEQETSKRQLCAVKNTPFVVLLLFEDTLLTAPAPIEILEVDVSDSVQFHGHLKGKAKLPSKTLGVLSRTK